MRFITLSADPLPAWARLSCVDRKEDAINGLSALMTSCFSLGQMLGPLAGSFMAARMGFGWASTFVGTLLLVQMAVLIKLQRSSRLHRQAAFDCFPCTGLRVSSELAVTRKQAQSTSEIRSLTAETPEGEEAWSTEQDVRMATEPDDTDAADRALLLERGK